MKKITKTFEVYEFSELSKEAKETVLKDNRMINVEDSSWHEPILEGWKEKLDAMGYVNPKILYSGFSSQGDGACFEADVDIVKWLELRHLEPKFPLLFADAQNVSFFRIKHTTNRYYYSTSTNVQYELESDALGNELYEKEIEELCKLVETDREKVGNQIYKALETYYFEQTDDKAVEETISINEWKFLENGQRFEE